MSHDASDCPTCVYCQLPLPRSWRNEALRDAAAYCCFGCKLAASVTGASGARGAARWTLARLGLAVFFTMNVMVFTMFLWSQDIYGVESDGVGPMTASLVELFRYLCLLFSLPVLWLLGGPIFANALESLRRWVVSTDLLILLGVTASYLYSAASVFRDSGHVYFEVGCMVLLMVTLGRWLEATGKLKTGEALDALEKLLPTEVLVVRDGESRRVSPDEIAIGERIHVAATERFAVDGRVVSGWAAVDEQLLTGESAPVTKGPGDDVFAGTQNTDGTLEIQATAAPGKGTLARLIGAVRAAGQRRGRYQRIADRAAAFFVPAVTVLALVTTVIHTRTGGLEQGIFAGLAVVLIACPCALGLATPMAVWTAMGCASRAQVLFGGGEALERLGAIRAIRFDKTGTLTTGHPMVDRVCIEPGASQNELFSRAAWIASYSKHTFSTAIRRYIRSITDAAGNHRPTDDQHSSDDVEISDLSGRGLVATSRRQGPAVYLGSPRFLKESGLAIGAALWRDIEDAQNAARPISCVGWEGRARGVFVFREELRREAAPAVATCRAEGLDVAVLTGDHAKRGEQIGAELGVRVEAELLPDGKVAAIEEARRTFGPTAMVGDGINDAPALVHSDVGIAMGCGADLARDSADVCLLTGDLMRVPWAIDLARRTVRVIRQNLFWAFAYNIVGIALATTGWLNPALAAVAMAASSTVVVTNSLRLARLDIHVQEPSPESRRGDDDEPSARLRPPQNTNEGAALVGGSM